MSIKYKVISADNINCIKNLCNELMVYQKTKAHIHPEWFDNMCFESRMIPAIDGSKSNFIITAKDKDEIIGYAYSNICSKTTYSDGFATLEPVDFFDFNSVKGDDVGCLSQFFIKEDYRKTGIGTILFNRSLDWLNSAESIDDIFIFVSNGNEDALRFYQGKGFKVSHQILGGFITVLRNF
ncbi:GNAT family N-acetyltransferase [Sporosalibacterium faouarense]|uniref:GNAT family N-acetyltransferase n=1 Tax=Sporosalibacterium faouarense TaxID=516123 RepID=UPI00141C93C4|nr:GNAT family N-acetyltransferase [Sporosalibacterium faouarense]MTI49142.1 GNAT family N-acetyltransferase [Bacillota bacterium]